MSENFAEIEKYLSQFGSGDVILSNKYFDKGLAVIYFNNPGKKNAISGKMMVQLRQCVQKLEEWKEGKAVLLCGLGGNFCSGGDLEFAKASGTQKEALYMSNWMQDTLTRLQKLPMFSVCLIQGPTLGGGTEVSLFCDFIIATEDVKYSFIHGKMGIITAWGGTTRLVEKIGGKKALNLLLTSQILNAQGCVENGIADHVVPVEDCLAKAMEWIDLRLQHHHQIIRSFKNCVNKAVRDTWENSLAYEKSLFSLTWGSEMNKEALAKNIKHIKMNNGNAKM
ncbi:ethylmalonyl-CoA decarboxylase-like [Tribolium madens]|uniref:ethylmalonyl-CoA decarboxylase-like n=1 Tax=Tribolium madens TaxID=41895 RepID=UPI001CF735C3|nr:ethylmalonyl-CoA decarboxylase-like [Tribolium madens]XP_044256185.1 ethylmalonyl-CoA decarboxylase-like [Tribolium madens]